MRQVVLYTREGCCLCDEARQLLVTVLKEVVPPVELQERDIEANDDLFRAYLERIPVVTIDGEEAFELFVDEAELRRRLGIVETA
jgi:glutaredoxin-like protein DUF836